MSTATTTSHDTSQHTTSRTITQPTANPTRPLRCPGTPYHDDGLSARCPARSSRAERRPRGCHCGRQDRRATPVGIGSVPVGGSGGGVFANGGRQWRACAESGASGIRLAMKTQRGAGPFGILLPSRWNQICVATLCRCVRPADAGMSANLHRQFPPVPSPTSMARARQPDLRDENRCCCPRPTGRTGTCRRTTSRTRRRG